MNIKLKLIPVKCAVIMKILYIFWPKKEKLSKQLH